LKAAEVYLSSYKIVKLLAFNPFPSGQGKTNPRCPNIKTKKKRGKEMK
jgi:hypothetical protein